MAKRKKGSVALFEVIQKSGTGAPSIRGALPTPQWWFKGKLAPPPPPPAIPQQPQPVAVRNTAQSPSLSEAMLGGSGQPPLTYTSAAIIGAALLLVLGVGILWTRWSHRSAVAAPTAQAALAGPAHPGVLDVATARPAAVPPVAYAPAPVASHASSVQTPARIPNQGYVVIRVYLTQGSATQARDLLNQHDIPCTIEHGVPGDAVQGFAVVGLTPFTAIGTPEFTAYVQKIKTVMTSHNIHPYWIKWPADGQTG